MEYTYLDYFNYYLKEYVNELINTFPETEQALLSNYRALLEGKDDKNDFYAKCFYSKINNFLAPIAKRDVTLFESPSKVFIEGIDLYEIWNNSNATPQTHIAIWKYLQILMILGRKIIPNHTEIVNILQKVSDGDVNIPAKVEHTLTARQSDETEDIPDTFGLSNIASDISDFSELANGLGGLFGGSGGAGGGIGSLLKGLTSGGGAAGGLGGGLGNIIESVSGIFKNPEFTNAMAQLSNPNAIPTQAKPAGTNCPPMTEKGQSGQEGQDTSTAPPAMDNNGGNTGEGTREPNISQLFNNPLFTDMAAEIQNTFNLEDMKAKDGQPPNLSNLIGKFGSGDNPAKLMNLIGKFGSKLQQEMQSGNINPAELIQQTMGAMGGGGADVSGAMQNMMQNLGQAAQAAQSNPKVQQMAKNQSTRDRLRAKLEQRK